MATVQSAGATGLVELSRGGSFIDDGEVVLDHRQLPQFLPRVDWPDPPLNRRPGVFASKNNLDNPAELSDALQKFAAKYGNVLEMMPYRSGTYFNVSWPEHGFVVHRILAFKLEYPGKRIEKLHPLDSRDMGALMRISSYGMYDTMCFFTGWKIFSDDGTSLTFYDSMSHYMAEGTFNEAQNTAEHCTSEIGGRRWIVVPIEFGNHHWVATIFDRQTQQLHIYDCGPASGQSSRRKACLGLWVRFLNEIGFLYHFQLVVPTVTQISPKNTVYSGYLCAQWIMTVLRGGVGDCVTVAGGTEPQLRHQLAVNRDAQQFSLTDAEIPCDDPCRYGIREGALIQDAIKFVKVLLRNELGVTDSIMQAPQGTGASSAASPWELIQNIVEYAEENGNMSIPRDEFWSGYGGPQFVYPSGPVRAYDDALRRRWRRNPAVLAEPLIGSHVGLLQRYPYNITMANTSTFTSNKPLPDRSLWVQALQSQDEMDTDDCLNFEATYETHHANGNQWEMDPSMLIKLSNIHGRMQTNGVRVLRTSLLLGMNKEQGFVPTQVTIPIPTDYIDDDDSRTDGSDGDDSSDYDDSYHISGTDGVIIKREPGVIAEGDEA